MKVIRFIIPTLILLLTIFINTAKGQGSSAPPDPPSGGHGGTGDAPGGGAPIGGGTFILLSLGTLYATKKLHKIKDKKD